MDTRHRGSLHITPLSRPEFTGMKGMKGITAKARAFRLKTKA